MRALATDFSSVAGGLLDLWGKGRGEGYFIMIYKGSGKQGLILHGRAPKPASAKLVRVREISPILLHIRR